MAINLNYMHAFSAQPGVLKQKGRLTHQRGSRWTAATLWVSIACFIAVPEARAISFVDGSAGTNPFFSSNWTLSEDPVVPENATAEFTENTLLFSTPLGFRGSSIFSLSSGQADQKYNISFVYTFVHDDPDDITSATYQICNTSGCNIAENFGLLPNTTLPTPISLNIGEFLRFSIENTPDTGGGELTISNFNATPVPSPLPFAGLGLAALGIYRARRRKAATPK